MLIQDDRFYLLKALEYAKIRRGFCFPNPCVGALIVDPVGIPLGYGYHFSYGSAHAEVDVLTKLSMKAEGATLYVTLEPCCHWGKTPPCTEAIIKSGIKRVIYSFKDPNPLVCGRGELALQEANICCEWVPIPEIQVFYKSYYQWHTTRRPFVTAKIAMSLDGKIAGKEGAPLEITGKKLSEFTHLSRLQADAMLTTIKTILYDNPQFNARYQGRIINKPVYILDSRLRLPLTAKILTTAKSLTVFYAEKYCDQGTKQKLSAQGVYCVPIEEAEGGLNLSSVLDYIGQAGVHDLWIEAGGTCFAAFLKAKLLQKAYLYIAPRWIGLGQSAFLEDFSLGPVKHFSWQQYDNDVLCEIDC